MSGPVVFAVPSKGRLKEQVEGWLADAGLALRTGGGARGYTAAMTGQPEVEVRLMSAGDIAEALDAGALHLGVTGQDLLGERGAGAPIAQLKPLGFGYADLVVAAPQGWLDVETMADLEEVAHLHLARTGRRLRVATKFLVQTRAFFARHGISEYRLVESSGATEGAPAQGAAELIVDITTTGATLRANHLKVPADGVILRSQACLAAGLRRPWSEGQLAAAGRMLRILEARSRALTAASLVWPAEQEAAAREAVRGFEPPDGRRRAHGLLVEQGRLFEAAEALAQAGVGPVTVTRPDYVFEPTSTGMETLRARLAEI